MVLFLLPDVGLTASVCFSHKQTNEWTARIFLGLSQIGICVACGSECKAFASSFGLNHFFASCGTVCFSLIWHLHRLVHCLSLREVLRSSSLAFVDFIHHHISSPRMTVETLCFLSLLSCKLKFPPPCWAWPPRHFAALRFSFFQEDLNHFPQKKSVLSLAFLLVYLCCHVLTKPILSNPIIDDRSLSFVLCRDASPIFLLRNVSGTPSLAFLPMGAILARVINSSPCS